MSEDIVNRLLKSIKKDIDKIKESEEEKTLSTNLRLIILECREKLVTLESILLNHCPIIKEYLNKNKDNKNEEE
jgi:Mg2+ and Co2+ transporter CorA